MEEEEEILLRKDAVHLKIKSYFTGKPCNKGHIARRTTGSGACMECRRLQLARWREEGYIPNEFKSKSTPETNYLLSRFNYNKATGQLLWTARDRIHFTSDRIFKGWNTRFAGKVAGSLHYANNYVEVRLDGKLYKAHRLVWKILKGYDSDLMLDHVNGFPFDNRELNLREVSPQENARNSKGRGKYKGVQEKGDGFIASYYIDNRSTWSRVFYTPEEAAQWYDDQVKRLYKEYAYLNFKGEENDKDIYN